MILQLITSVLLSSVNYPQFEKQIIKNAPHLEQKYVKRLAKVFNNAQRKYKIPAQVMIAIANVESSYKLNAVNKSSNDYGIMQINKYHLKKYSKHKLLTDLEYSVNAGFEVFSWFYAKYSLQEAIMRYNCGTKPSCVKLPKVQQYLKKVEKSF